MVGTAAAGPLLAVRLRSGTVGEGGLASCPGPGQFASVHGDGNPETVAPSVKLGRWQSWVTLVAALGVVLVLVNMVLVERNRTLQAEVNARGQYIQQTARVDGLHRELINAIANLAVRNKDDALRTILIQ